MTAAAGPFRSTCSYCGVGCGLEVHQDRGGRLRVVGDAGHPVNRGMLCSKGLNLAYAMEDRGDRLRHPEMRDSRGHPRRRVGWDTAIDRAAAVFGSLIDRFGPDSVGFYVSGQCLTEEYYLANKLVKGFLGTNNIDTNSRLCMSSAVAGYVKTLGEDSVPICYDDIELSDCIFVAGANPAWCHPILWRRVEAHKAANPDVKVIVADPRRTESAVLADLYLPLAPGSDVHLFNAIARVLIERGRVDTAFIEKHVDGYEEYRDVVMRTSLAEAAARCDLDPSLVVKAADCIADARGFLTMWAMGLNQSVVGVDKNLALIALNLITGHIGKPGSGPFSLTGQPNAMGGREVGGMATLLAAHRDLANPAHRQEVADFWGVPTISERPGLAATEMFDALDDGRLKAVWIIATNPMVSLPDVSRAERALERARFVVVQDISRRADTLRFADLVLPAAGHFEKDGTMTNSERRISYLEKIVEPPGEALSDVEILMRFARAMGFHGFDFLDASEVFDEHARLTAGTNIDVSGLSHVLLRERGTVQWPFTPRDVAAASLGAASPSGTARLFTDRRFFTSTGRARLHPVAPSDDAAGAPTPDFPLVLTTGRLRDQWHTRTKTGKVSRLNRHVARPFVAMHPADALERGIGPGDIVRVWSAQGEARLPAEVTDEVRPGLLFIPMHWGKIGDRTEARANNLTAALIDPVSKEPDFKRTPVQVQRVSKPKERIVVVGAGAAAYRFVHAYRTLNRTDEIHVFSAEPHAFYDRVRLPEYVNEQLPWERLVKFAEGELEALDLRMHRCTRVERVDRTRRVVADENGVEHPYDKLVVATGSRAFVPPGAPVGQPGIFTMRTRADADALKRRLAPGASVLVVGGGLLGLELAAALTEVDVGVTIVELGGRLMERQLDALAAEILMEYVEEMGVSVHMNDQVQAIEQRERGVRATLQSGVTGAYDAVVFAIGTRPNVGLLEEAGVECGRGVIVNDHLQTSDPAVYAMGEIAEHRGTLYGITAAAEEQATVVARHVAGDPLATYESSVPMNILKFSGLDLCSMGMPSAPAGSDGYQEIVFLDRAERYYKKCVIRDDRLVGAILIGDKAELAEFKDLIGSGLELSDRRKRILRSGQAAEPPIGRLVCSCNNVGEGNLARALEAGCSGMEEVCASSGAGLGCGSCKPEIQRFLSETVVGAT